jgi:ATP-dependent protease ClpP protease subunit
MHLFDQIVAYSKRPWDTSDKPRGQHPTTMTVRGYAASMGGILLQAADHRIIGPESYLMIHEVATYFRGKVGDMEDEIEFLRMVSDRVAESFLRRAKYLKGGDAMSKEDFYKLWKKTDKWLSSEQSLDHGFVDEIG